MARKALRLLLFLVVIISLGFFTLKGFGREQGFEKRQDLTAISGKIEKILRNQQDIITRLGDVREQLDIIRVRASRR
jgi:hypothetical protein